MSVVKAMREHGKTFRQIFFLGHNFVRELKFERG